ncbi:protein of unknown function [Methylacidimicrobium sp. AP8]|nr:protein of unknown function [Methylacidimicrobium sp. AP8]
MLLAVFCHDCNTKSIFYASKRFSITRRCPRRSPGVPESPTPGTAREPFRDDRTRCPAAGRERSRVKTSPFCALVC